MTGKPWWASAGMVGGIGTIAVGIAQIYSQATGIELDFDSVRSIVENGASLLLGVATLVTGAMSLWGRIRAKEPIKKQILPKPDVLPWLKDKQPPQ